IIKFAKHKNIKTLINYYLDDISNVDGAAAFLNLEWKRNFTEDFRSMSIRKIPDILFSLPSKDLEKLERRKDFVKL
ncbi:hypothetical protein QBC40DRAFT_157584, partial [Triangularia verruculosa]